jgi:hypothetical protein
MAFHHFLYCALTVDEMSIHSHVDLCGDKYIGLVHIVSKEIIEEREAKEAYVFMLTCMEQNWKVC